MTVVPRQPHAPRNGTARNGSGDREAKGLASSSTDQIPLNTSHRDEARDIVLLETRVPHVLSLLAGSILNETLRESDTVRYEAADDRLVIAFAESDRERTRVALNRVAGLIATQVGIEVRAGIAQFPEDGLTLDDLIATAEASWGGDR